MVAFVTLLLGLISGTVPIEVAVTGPVARVEILLDGRAVRGISGPPWRGEVNLGERLEPHELVARALDAKGEEIARAAQWLNLPRPPAEVEIVLDSDPAGKPTAAHLSWQNVEGSAPTSIGLTFDGKPLILDARRQAQLPRYDFQQAHVLAAEVEFDRGVTGRREVAFGGEYGTTISTELTAIVVRSGKRSPALSPGSLQGRLVADGQPLAVAAVEQGPGKVIVVSVPGPQPLRRRWLPFDQGLKVRGEIRPEEVLASAGAGSRRDRQTEMLLGGDVVARILLPQARGFGGGTGVGSDLFPLSPELSDGAGGLLGHLTQNGLSNVLGAGKPGALRIADAVAVAGLQAAVENRRRAVVLVLGDNETDASRYSIEAVRRYLSAVRVPFYVWTPFGSKSPLAKAWGEAEDVSTLPRLHQAFQRLKADLEAQRIVWVEGQHLPQAVHLAPGAGGVELVLPGAASTLEPKAAR